MGTSDPIGSPGPTDRAPDRTSGPLAQVARDQARLRASQAAVTSDVIEFQLARQRAGLASLESIEPLSTREREVLALLGAGRADGQIADELFISKKTASVHVANIKAKLCAASRVEIALIAARLGLAEGLPQTPPDDAPASRARSTTVICPFKGLASYEAADARYFFGREPVVAALVARMVGAGILGLVGPSGSGKSSVLRAGLLPALADGVLPGSERWTVGMLRPGATPGAELRAALGAALRRAGLEPPDGGGVTDALDRLPDGVRLVVAADQFEELFTICDDEEERVAFVDDLVRLARDKGGRAVVVVVIRADQYGRCAAYRELAEGLAANHLLIGAMTAEELGRAVELPARAAGLRVEPQLTAALVSAVAGEPGGLPLLSTTLLELWQRRDGRTMRLEAYERIGGVSGAVARLAESAYARLTDDQRSVARAVVLRLVTVGSDGTLSRRPITPDTFDAERDPDVGRVLAILTESRLVAIDEGRLEIAHEALLREWPRLRRWIEEDAGDRAVREHLARAAMDWERGGRSPAELYRGARLSAAIDWYAAHQRELSAAERSFVEASRIEADREITTARRTNRRLRALLGAAVVLLIVALLAAGFAAVQERRAQDEAERATRAATLAQEEADRADRSAELARSRELAASAVAVLDEDAALAKLLLVAAASVDSPPLEDVVALHAAMAEDRIVARYAWSQADRLGGSLWADLDPTGARFVASGVPEEPSSILEVVDIAAGQPVWRFTPETPRAVIGPAFYSADGMRVITGTARTEGAAAPARAGLGLRQLDARTGRVLDATELGPCGGVVVGVSGTHALVRFLTLPPATSECTSLHREAAIGIGIVDLRTGGLRVLAEKAAAGGEAISGDARRVAFNDLSGPRQLTVVVDLLSGERIFEIDALDHNTWARALNHDGSLLLASDRPILVYDVDGGGTIPLTRFHGHAGDSFHAEFVPGGDIVWSTGRDASLRQWDGASGAELAVIGAVGSGRPSLSDDGRHILVADIETARVSLVDSRPRGEVGAIETCIGRNIAATLSVAAGAAAFMQGCNDDEAFLGVLQIADLESQTIRHSISGIEGQTLRFSPDGSRIVYQSSAVREEGHFPWAEPITVVDVRSGAEVLELDGLCAWDWEQVDVVGRNEAGPCRAFPEEPFPIWVLALRWSPDGSLIFAADNHNAEGYFGVWDAATGSLVHAGSNASGQAFDAMFTPDSSELILARYDTGRLDRLSTRTWEVLQSVELDASVEGRDRLWFAGWSPDNSTLLAVGGFLGGGGGSLVWLDGETLQPVRTVAQAHDGSPKAVALSPDGTRVATGGSGDPVRIWDVGSGALVHEIPMGNTQVQGVAFVDDRHVAVAPQDGNLLFMTIDPDELLATARSSLTRGFTAQECERYDFGEDCPTLEEMRAD